MDDPHELRDGPHRPRRRPRAPGWELIGGGILLALLAMSGCCLLGNFTTRWGPVGMLVAGLLLVATFFAVASQLARAAMLLRGIKPEYEDEDDDRRRRGSPR